MTATPSRQIEVDDLTPRLAYKAVVGAAIPRPIAWITTVSESGLVNLAPFSFFTPMGYRPAMFGVAISELDGGREKDTLRNIRDTEEFVINIAGAEFSERLHQTGARLPHDRSEAEEFGVALVPSSTVRPPRVDGAPASFECRLVGITSIPGASQWVVGRCKTIHLRSDLVDDELNVDFESFKPLGRLIGNAYQLPGDVARVDV